MVLQGDLFVKNYIKRKIDELSISAGGGVTDPLAESIDPILNKYRSLNWNKELYPWKK